MARAAAEEELPAVDVSNYYDNRAADFLRPSALVISMMMDKLDVMTADISQQLLFAEPQDVGLRPINERLSRLLEHGWVDGSSIAGGLRNIPSGLLGRPSGIFFQQAAGTMWKRYQHAREAVRQ